MKGTSTHTVYWPMRPCNSWSRTFIRLVRFTSHVNLLNVQGGTTQWQTHTREVHFPIITQNQRNRAIALRANYKDPKCRPSSTRVCRLVRLLSDLGDITEIVLPMALASFQESRAFRRAAYGHS